MSGPRRVHVGLVKFGEGYVRAVICPWGGYFSKRVRPLAGRAERVRTLLMFDFHCIFSSGNILIMERRDYTMTVTEWLYECILCSKLNAAICPWISSFFQNHAVILPIFYRDFNTSLKMKSVRDVWDCSRSRVRMSTLWPHSVVTKIELVMIHSFFNIFIYYFD